ncbi:hypothetical protein GCM10010327_48690 [Streptomyces nitrosporeus]|nr:hypothetical protein GCM10010327_48690 [Streptomyces nitrosporeus]
MAPGFSFCVHHLALQLRPWWETVPPAVYAVVAFQVGAHAWVAAAGAAAAVAAWGSAAAAATTALRTVRNLLMRFSAAHSFGAAHRTVRRADLTGAGH